jgi:RecJ-like exonuclease
MSKIDDLEKQYQDKVKELAELEKKIISEIDKQHEDDDSYVKIECPNCKGNGHYKDKDNKLKVCNMCIDGRGWIWVKKYIESK